MPEILSQFAHRDEWLAARRQGIGASEIAAVLGLSPWDSPFSLYWSKVQGWQAEETEEMSTGTRVEDVTAAWWCDANDPHENLSVVPTGLWAHPARPWQLATPDRLVYLLDSPVPAAVLECKWTSTWDGWGEAGTAAIPVYYRTQVLWQCDVVGVDEWHLAVLGPSGFRAYQGHRDDTDLKMMREAGRRFMDRLANQDQPPVDEHPATVTALRHLHPDLDDTEVEVPEQIAAAYRRAVAMRRLAEKVESRYEAQLRELMGPARRAVSGGRKVATHVISDVAASVRAAHRRDYLLAARGPK